jgi:hypothetical protein
MLSRTPLTEAALNQLCDALKVEIQELRDVARATLPRRGNAGIGSAPHATRRTKDPTPR